MSEYGDLPSTIGKMKRAAIDCWMADNAFYPNWGNEMIYAKWGWMLNFYNRPDENGNGGGDGNGVNHSVEAQFEQIRSAVDATLAPWSDLPDGAANDAPRGMASAAAAKLGTSGASATVQNSGEIGTSNNTIHETVINKMTGSFRAPFLDKYYTQFSMVTQGLGDACVLLETNYIAQHAMWPAARADVATLCDNALNAWNQKAAKAAAANGTVVLTVVGAVAGVVSSVVTAGTGTVAAVAALGTLAAAANTAMAAISANAEVSGNTYPEILGSLSQALGKLNGALQSQERALDTMMARASTEISGDLANYNLDAFSLNEYPPADGMISIDRSDASIVSTNMVRIENALSAAMTSLGSAPASNPAPRDATVGLGASGTHTSASSLYSLAAQCLSLTQAEYAIGRELFDATVEDFFSTDDDVSHIISNLLADEALTTEV